MIDDTMAHSQVLRAVPHSAAERKPDSTTPPLSCDAHIHIYNSLFPSQEPIISNADVQAYRKMQALIGTRRTVVVQPRAYGADNNAILHAIHILGSSHARGVAVVNRSIDNTALRKLHDGGVRGIRFSLYRPNSYTGGFDSIEHIARKILPFGWHLQLHWTADQIFEHRHLLERLPVQLVFDHLARLPVREGLNHPAFGVVRDLLKEERAWVKLSGAYLDTIAGIRGGYGDVDPIARAWIESAPHRLVWGSDWPHVTEQYEKPDDAELFDLLSRWCGNEEIRHQILVENPVRLYGFDG